MEIDELIDEILEDCYTATRLNILSGISSEQDWTSGGKVHNWKNYVPDYCKTRWPLLCQEARAMIFGMAYHQAEAENWD